MYIKFLSFNTLFPKIYKYQSLFILLPQSFCPTFVKNLPNLLTFQAYGDFGPFALLKARVEVPYQI